VPPEQILGWSIKTKFQMRDGRPELFRLPEVNFVDDQAGKPSAQLSQRSRRRPMGDFIPAVSPKICCSA